MASWSEVEAAAPELAARARELLDASRHKTLATLRRDGSPRISGTEVAFHGGELYMGSMWRSVKALDLLRDPRFALHSASLEEPDWRGDAKLAGTVEEVTDPGRVAEVYPPGEGVPQERFHVFRAEIGELVVVGLDEAREQMLIDSWHQGRGLSRRKR